MRSKTLFEHECARMAAATLVVGAGCLANAAAQETPADRTEGERPLEVVTHFIRPGDTFSQVTQKLLGSSRDWRRNSDLNPQYVERQLQPGERMLVLIDPRRHPNAARVEDRSGSVEGQPTPLRWTSLEQRDLLLENDATRTGPGSSAQLVFGDGAAVTISEDSLVYLRQLSDRLLSEVPTEVEVVSGQADLSLGEADGAAAAVGGIDVVLGGAKLAIPGNQPAQVRAGRIGTEKSKASVYAGPVADFTNAGAAVQLEAGTGVAAAAGEVPVPEKLIAAPEDLRPADGAQLADDRAVELSWTVPVEPDQRHDRTIVELCSDSDCALLLRRSQLGTETTLSLEGLARGTYFWRVNAVSATGVDGFVSPATRFEIVEPFDRVAPRARVAVLGRTMPFGGNQVYRGDPQLEVEVEDDDSGVASTRVLVNDVLIDEAKRDGLLPTGPYRIVVEVTDQAGNVGKSETLTIHVEGSRPTITVDQAATPVATPPRRRFRKRRAATAEPIVSQNILWSVDGVSWRALRDVPVTTMSRPFELRLHAPSGRCFVADGSPACRATVLVQAADAEVGMRALSAVSGEDSSVRVHAEDHVGNESSLSLRTRASDPD